MPLARIVTSTPNQVAALSEYLRSRGYTVELIEPGALRTSPAELEMDLQGCSAEEAMSRGISAAEAAQLYGGRKAIAYDITGRPVAFADEEEPEAPRANAVTQAWTRLRSAGREILDNLRLPVGRLREWFAEGRQTVQEHRARYQEERSQAQVEKEREREAQLLAREAERSRREREEAARRVELAATRERIREQQEQARREEAAERERRILERYRREARLDVVHERFQVEQQEAQQQIAPAEAVLARRQPGTRLAPSAYHRNDDWKKAAVAAIGIALLATLGYAAYEHRQPAAPLSNRDLVRSQNISQPVPFGAAIAAPSQASTAPPSHGPLPQSDVAPTTPAAPAPSVRTRRVRHTSRSADDTIADDEVIVHRSGPAPSRPTAKNNTPKHISDLEQ